MIALIAVTVIATTAIIGMVVWACESHGKMGLGPPFRNPPPPESRQLWAVRPLYDDPRNTLRVQLATRVSRDEIMIAEAVRELKEYDQRMAEKAEQERQISQRFDEAMEILK